ncbi:hypothetical protein Sjap_022169 [Stephania japonica]|uniref:Uncharacterized protein n=1 Tax=Stephania japonica TaxID=461633 RepID=A0AAP0HTG5_9MAGN
MLPSVSLVLVLETFRFGTGFLFLLFSCFQVQAIVKRSTGQEVIFLAYGLNRSSCSSNGFDKFFLV